jgi:transcriptional regulator with XRE-family HTH domain
MEQPAKPAALRNAAALEVEATSLRSVAREIGMSPTGLKKFLNGTMPYAPTLRRLRRWHEERLERLAKAGPRRLDLELFATALDLLFCECDPDAAAAEKERAYACLEHAHGTAIPRTTPPTRALKVEDCGCARSVLPLSAQPAPVQWTVNPAQRARVATA